jgi:hypothetical protein
MHGQENVYMPFKNGLKVTKLKNGNLVLDESLVYQSPLLGGTVVIPKGFVTDGVTAPPTLRKYVSQQDKDLIKPAVLHDFAYSNHIGKPLADDLFKEALDDTEANEIKKALALIAVRMFGKERYRRH